MGFDRLDYAACETASVPTASPARGWPAGHDVEVTACPIQPPGAEVCIPRAAPAHGQADLGLTSVFGGTSLKGLRSAAIPGLPSPPLAAILELPHSLGDLQ
jgi:hypothetical protein